MNSTEGFKHGAYQRGARAICCKYKGLAVRGLGPGRVFTHGRSEKVRSQ